MVCVVAGSGEVAQMAEGKPQGAARFERAGFERAGFEEL
jgi:hypothetical protein